MPAKHSYMEMIHQALVTLDDKRRKGASRMDLWKCIEATYPEADKKTFVLRLRKMTADTLNGIEHVNGNKARFRLTASMSEKIARRLHNGQSVKTAFKSLAVVKPMKMAQKKRKDAKKAAKNSKSPSKPK
jgi:hypothetical protein